MLGMEPNYLPCFRGLVSARFGPQTPTSGCGGYFPPTIAVGGSKGGGTPESIFYENVL